MLVFDTETTGLIENMTTRGDLQPEIIEFCGITLDKKFKVIDVYDKLIKPKKRITEEITKLNGIDNAMVDGALTFVKLAPMIRDLIERSDVVVAHNAAFDRDMVDIEFKKLGLTKIAWPPIICTVEATIHLKGYRLSQAALYELLFKETFSGAHRARADVEALVRIVKELKKRKEI